MGTDVVRMAWVLGPKYHLFAHFGSAHSLSKFMHLRHLATLVFQSLLPSLKPRVLKSLLIC